MISSAKGATGMYDQFRKKPPQTMYKILYKTAKMINSIE